MLIKSRSALDYENCFLTQVPSAARRLGVKSPVSLRVKVWYQSCRSDLDIEYVKDLLQKSGVLDNDRWVFHVECEKEIDPKDPRVEIEIHQKNEKSVFENSCK